MKDLTLNILHLESAHFGLSMGKVVYPDIRCVRQVRQSQQVGEEGCVRVTGQDAAQLALQGAGARCGHYPEQYFFFQERGMYINHHLETIWTTWEVYSSG